MRRLVIIAMLAYSLTGCQTKPETKPVSARTFANPLNLSYRFCLDEPSRREAADPTVAWFKDRYYLFASKSGGYWHSGDLLDWTFIETSEIPTEEYAPTVIAINDTLYFLASSNEKSTIYKSGDPLSGKWQVALDSLEIPVWDPAFFLDDDNRLYLYWGCSNENPLYGVEVDFNNNFAFKGKPLELIHGDPDQHGWEVPGDYNTITDRRPWIEGAWMNKVNGKYYLQYSGPGTEFKSYSDGVYVADSPLGPYQLQAHNPFAYRPEGFAAAAGHGSTFSDTYGNYWHIGTITISQKHMFERRLGLYPVFLDSEGTMYASTKYADYPMVMPQKKIDNADEIFAGWQLLSYNKKAEVSSSIDSLPSSFMTDEDIRTYWAASSGKEGEYATLDLGEAYDVYALQLNFAEHQSGILGRQKNLYHRYVIEYSSDGDQWTVLIDNSTNDTDRSHDYFELPEKVACRYVRIRNVEVPGGHFAISGFRVFGKGSGDKPGIISNFKAERNAQDRRSITLTWSGADNADGYNISYGVTVGGMYHNYMLYGDTTVIINSLDVNQKYYFTIEAFNENGITPNDIKVEAE